MDDKISKCRSCNADIIWMETVKGKSVPVDPENIRGFDKNGFFHEIRRTHFASCPDARNWSKKNG